MLHNSIYNLLTHLSLPSISASGPCALEAERFTSPPANLFMCNAKVCTRTATVPLTAEEAWSGP